MKAIRPLAASLTTGLLVTASAHAQTSSVTLYGVLDEYLGYQSSTVSGAHKSLAVLGSNGEWTSRFGLKGTEDIGNGYHVNFNLETGFDPTTGGLQNSFSFFDRQAWIGLSGDFGELRFGRQYTPMFAMSGSMDAFGSATYASGFNDFALWLNRVTNDISYRTPKVYGTQLEFHYSPGGVPGSLAGNAVYQIAAQTQQGPVFFGAAYLNAANATNTNRVQEFMAGGNWDYVHGRVYLAYFRANEVISATTGNALTNPAGKFDPAVGPVSNNRGNYHSTYSLSADYRINPQLSVGAGYALIRDSSSVGNNARQFGAIANYELSKRTRLYAVATRLQNSSNAQFKMANASLTSGTFLTPDRGQSETGFQIGVRHLF